MSWKLLDSRMHLSNRWLTLRENDYELPGGKRLPSYWVIEKPSYVLVIGESRKGLVLVREYRPGSGKVHLSFPAGFIDEGETPEQAAVREFQEETGFFASKPKVIGTLDAQAAWLKATCTVVHVEASDRPEVSAVDAEIEAVLLMDWGQVLEKVREGAITEMHSVAGFYMARDLLDRS
ncbi:MAG: NUDIX hydrolase [Acidobacteria bacterium]|nr:NUDIX hydrolase [Acidobacteriota bacterium]